jgi:hypothetical protein
MLGSTTVRTLLGGLGGERYRQQSVLAEVRRAPVMRQVGAPREALLIWLRFWCAQNGKSASVRPPDYTRASPFLSGVLVLNFQRVKCWTPLIIVGRCRYRFIL